jgi:hypothetical protein
MRKKTVLGSNQRAGRHMSGPRGRSVVKDHGVVTKITEFVYVVQYIKSVRVHLHSSTFE